MIKTQRHTIIPAVFVMFKKDDQILVLRRHNTGYADGKLTLVSGHVDQGESFTAAALREAKEEAGVLIALADLKPVHVMHRLTPTGQERVDTYFLAERWSGEIMNAEPHKASELFWVPLHALPDDVLVQVRQAVELIGKGVFYSERWDNLVPGWE